jgi:uncharacterized protein YndB with AHSA1/START domain
MTELPPVVAHSITVTRVIPASPATLYAAWTEPEQMRQWYATVVEADVRVGGRYRIENHEKDGTVNAFTGEYLVLDPTSIVKFSFTHHSQTPADRISDETVTVTFREVEPGRTEVAVTNDWRGPQVEPSDYDVLRAGWDEWISLLEKHYS